MDAKNVMELGCGCGRNLAELRRKYVDLGVIGVDINADAIRECKSTLPAKSIFTAANLYDMLLSPVYAADVIFTVGVLGHLERTGAERLVSWMRHRARQAVVLVEEPGFGTIAKGPASWDALKSTGDYVLWRHNFDTMIGPSVRSIENLPQHLQAPAATTLYVLRPA
jgi:trans-aconitate methyltransferase